MGLPRNALRVHLADRLRLSIGACTAGMCALRGQGGTEYPAEAAAASFGAGGGVTPAGR